MEYVINNLDEMREFAKVFLRELDGCGSDDGGAGEARATVVGLYGDLGAGKTAFVKELAKELGIEQHITSPTFVILKKYKIQNLKFKTLIHIDAYRLQNGEDLKVLNWDEIIKDSKNLILIEWPERVEKSLPSCMIKIRFEYVSEGVRKVNF